MDSKIVFVKTAKGEEEIGSRKSSLTGDIRRALLMVDGKSSFDEISKHAAPSLRGMLDGLFKDLIRYGYIQDKVHARPEGMSVGGLKVPPAESKEAAVKPKQSEADLGELDFTGVFRAPTPAELAAEGARIQAEKQQKEAEARSLREAERMREQQASEAARLKAEQEAARLREEVAQTKMQAQQEAEVARQTAAKEAARARKEAEAIKRHAAEAMVRVRAEADRQSKEKAEAVRLEVEREAARMRTELETAKARAEAQVHAEVESRVRQESEAARQHAEQEAARARAEAEQLRREAEEAKVRAEAEARAHAEAEARMRQEAEAAKLKAQQESEAARQLVEREAARAREEAEQLRREAEEAKARAEAEAEARVRQEAEAAKLKVQQEAEAAKLFAEQEAARAREEAEQLRREAEEAKARAEAEARAHAEAEARMRQEAEAAKLQAQQEAEAAKLFAEQEAARAREEAEQLRREAEEAKARAEARVRQVAEAAKLKVHQETEAARQRAEQEAALAREEAEQLRHEAEEAKARADVEVRVRREAEVAKLKAQQEAEVARQQAEQETARAREEAERLRREAEEAKLRAGAAAGIVASGLSSQDVALPRIGESAQEGSDDARLPAEQSRREPADKVSVGQGRTVRKAEASRRRSTTATVLFFDVVGYTKQSVNQQIKIKKRFNQIVSDCLATLGDDERIILDTGDGAAIGFLQHPEDALQVARQFRSTVTAHHHQDYPDLEVRTGIHLGPVSIIKDMNGQSNMVGDGINDAQRVMGFAGIDQIYISRPYYDFISRLSDEYVDLFQYRGYKQDKHGREHAVYELVEPSAEPVTRPEAEAVVPIKLEPFVFTADLGGGGVAPTEPANIVTEQAPELASGVVSATSFAEFKLPEEPLEPPLRAGSAEVLPISATVPVEPHPAEMAVEKSEAIESPRQMPEPPAAAMPSEEEMAALAAAQAKVWAEAEQRAAKSREARVIQQTASKVESKQLAMPVRQRRKAVPWGWLGAGLLVMAIVALFVAPLVVPLRDYAGSIEQNLSARLQHPVHVGSLSGRLLPLPRLELTDVSIGDAKTLKINRVRVDFAISALFSSTRKITTLSLDGLQVDGSMLSQFPAWFKQVASDVRYPVGRIVLEKAAVAAEGASMAGIGGELGFDAEGRLAQAKLHANEGRYEMNLSAIGEGKFGVEILVRNSPLPLLSAWNFDDLKATGELTADALNLGEIDGTLLDGRLLGNLTLSWSAGWQVAGSLEAKVITLQKLGVAISGDLDGATRLRAKADSLSRLPAAAQLEGGFVANKGTINGIDIVETARLRSRENLPGGRTHFDELSGNLVVENGNFHFRGVRMKGGLLSASGSLDVERGQLSGQLLAELAMSGGNGAVGLQIGGTPTVPTVRMR